MATTTWLRAHCAKPLVLWPSTSKFYGAQKKNKENRKTSICNFRLPAVSPLPRFEYSLKTVMYNCFVITTTLASFWRKRTAGSHP